MDKEPIPPELAARIAAAFAVVSDSIKVSDKATGVVVSPSRIKAEKDAARLAELESQYPILKTPGYWKLVEENCEQWARDVTVQKFWIQTNAAISTWDAEYRKIHGGDLLAAKLDNFVGKGAQRIQSKALNQSNTQFSSGEIQVPNLNDLVRTRVSCTYVDGVEFFASKLEKHGEELGIKIARNRQGRTEGYFAQHCYFDENVFFRFSGKPFQIKVRCEIQVATQLGTRVWEATHKLYEQHRDEQQQKAENWQWNPNDPRFIAHQLGHMIHLADGLIVQLRNLGEKK